jgi:predicted outer membrane protein
MKHTLSRDITLTVVVASLALAGCKGKDNVAVADTTSASTMGMADSTKMNAANTSTAAPLSDGNIAGLIDEVNVADSTLAAAALPKLTNSGARGFARLMMGEHHALHVKGLALEKEQKITPEVPAADPFKGAVGAEQSALAPLPKGVAYDSTYMANEIGIHQAVIEWQGKNVPQNQALQGYMKDAKGVYQKHLDQGNNVLTKLSGHPSS